MCLEVCLLRRENWNKLVWRAESEVFGFRPCHAVAGGIEMKLGSDVRTTWESSGRAVHKRCACDRVRPARAAQVTLTRQ